MTNTQPLWWQQTNTTRFPSHQLKTSNNSSNLAARGGQYLWFLQQLGLLAHFEFWFLLIHHSRPLEHLWQHLYSGHILLIILDWIFHLNFDLSFEAIDCMILKSLRYQNLPWWSFHNFPMLPVFHLWLQVSFRMFSKTEADVWRGLPVCPSEILWCISRRCRWQLAGQRRLRGHQIDICQLLSKELWPSWFWLFILLKC